MIRLFDMRLDKKFQLRKGLKEVYGFSDTIVSRILNETGFLGNALIGSLTEENLVRLANTAEGTYSYGGALRVSKMEILKQGLRRKEARFVRQSKGLPSRNQHTCTNGKSAKRLNRRRFKHA